jgi:hypothetical protein
MKLNFRQIYALERITDISNGREVAVTPSRGAENPKYLRVAWTNHANEQRKRLMDKEGNLHPMGPSVPQ